MITERSTLQTLRLALISTVFTLPLQARATEPAFDCAEATGQVQQLVCSDSELAGLDRRLNDVYQTALQNLPPDDLPRTRQEQRGWIKGRDDCWKDDNVKDCAALSYQTRIVELQIISGQLTAPNTISLECGSSEQTPFLAAFYNDTSPPAAVLTWGRDQVVAFVARSGSGARYTADGVEFWEHQGQVSIDWFGTKLECAAKK